MLLRHAWLAELLKPPTQEEAEARIIGASGAEADMLLTADQEVADWAMAAIEKRRSGAMSKKAKPALHAVSLDAVATSPNTSPSLAKTETAAATTTTSTTPAATASLEAVTE